MVSRRRGGILSSCRESVGSLARAGVGLLQSIQGGAKRGDLERDRRGQREGRVVVSALLSTCQKRN